MAEYIKRGYAVDAVLDVYCDTPDIDLSCEKFEAAILKIPAADVTPVRHGRWMNANSRPKTYWRKCTACGGLAYFCGIGCSYKYCPNCGAMMDGGAGNGC